LGDTAWRFCDCEVGGRNITWVGLASDELLPSFSTLTDDIRGVLSVFALSSECELVLRLSIWDLIDTEPFIGGPQKTWQVSLNILDIIELWCQWVIDIDDNNLPVSLLLIEKSHNTKDLDLLDLTRVSDQFSDLADVQWVIVSLGLGLGVDDVGVFPGLGERAIVPEIALVGEAVADESKFAFLDILLNWVKKFLLADLQFGIGPSWDLDDHVQDCLLLICIERNVVEGGDWDAILLDVDAVIEGVWLADLSDCVLRGHVCGC